MTDANPLEAPKPPPRLYTQMRRRALRAEANVYELRIELEDTRALLIRAELERNKIARELEDLRREVASLRQEIIP